MRELVVRIFIAAGLGLLAHSFIGYQAFPIGDDWAYAPLSELRADPSLYPRDDQIRMFSNHARVYEWVYQLGKDGPGVEPMFRAAVWGLAALSGVLIWLCLSALGAPFAALPAVLGIGLVVQIHGLGRGDYGGLISPFFHHHNIALNLVLMALIATLLRRVWWAGIILGLAVYAQPMTAFHGALAVGLGAMLRAPLDTGRMALAAIAVSAPAALPILGTLAAGEAGPINGFDIVEQAYRFRAPHHYDPDWHSLTLTTLYLSAGVLGALQLNRQTKTVGPVALGVMLGFTLLHLVSLFVYKQQASDWVGFFILDANRSSALLFALAPTVVLAALWQEPRAPLAWAACTVLAIVLVLNHTFAGLLLVAAGALFFAIREQRFASLTTLVTSLGALVLFFPPAPVPSSVPAATKKAFEAIRTQTPKDALFVIPTSLYAFRYYTQRSAYVDFKMFSVYQPDQAALTRHRINQVAPPSAENAQAQGWAAARAWDEDQRLRADCPTMRAILTDTGADYYLRQLAKGEPAPNCTDLPRSITTGTLALYGPLD